MQLSVLKLMSISYFVTDQLVVQTEQAVRYVYLSVYV